MTTLYIDHKESRLQYRNRTLTLCSAEKSRNVPLHLIQRIIIHQNTALDSNTLLALGERNISLVVIGKRDGLAQILGSPHNSAEPRMAQYRLFSMDRPCNQLALETVRARLQGELKLLQRAIDRRPDKQHPLTVSQRQIHNILKTLHSHLSRPQLRGKEGAAANAYFKGYTTLFPPSLQFEQRRKRPPPDPVNALLSLGYTLLHHDAIKALWAAGLDPWVGYYHDLSYGRHSLASDLIESSRHHIEQFTWELIRERTVRESHFYRQQQATLLNKEGRRIYYMEWEQRAPAIRRLLRLQAWQLSRWVTSQP